MLKIIKFFNIKKLHNLKQKIRNLKSYNLPIVKMLELGVEVGDVVSILLGVALTTSLFHVSIQGFKLSLLR